MTTVADLIQATRRELFGMHRPEYNLLDATLDDSTTAVTVSRDATAISPGSYIAIDDELMLVWDISSTNLTVTRGLLGSTAAAHTDGALVEVNPLFPDFAIRDKLKQEIRSWVPRLFAVETLALEAGTTDRAIDLDGAPVDYLEVLSVLRSPRSGDTSWFQVPVRYERNLATADFPSGSAIFLDGSPELTVDLRVTIAKPFDLTAFTNATTLSDIGVAESQEDIAALGAVWRLVSGREIKRNFSEGQPEPRDAAEVPPGAITQSARAIKVLRDERIREEMNRLRNLYPYRRR